MRRLLLSTAIVLIAGSPAFAGAITISNDQTVPLTLNDGDTLTIDSSGSLKTSDQTIFQADNAPSGISVDNSGTIESDGDVAFYSDGGSDGHERSISITNNAGASIIAKKDGLHIDEDITTGTVDVENFGTIRSKKKQAIDFDEIQSGTASVTIHNHAGGVIRADQADGIRPGQGAVVNNEGTICVGDYSAGTCSGAEDGGKSDGVDWQANSGTLTNSGLISGQRHGTTSDTGVNVNNLAGGVILGRNGSGVGSDGIGTVVNHGTIEGTYDGTSTNGDGDGVDIDFVGHVTNYGIIKGTGANGVGSDGLANTSQGLALGGGTVDNMTGASIYGKADGILVDDSSQGPAGDATIITNAGAITGAERYGIKLVGNQDDEIDNAGSISGAIKAIDMGGGDDTLTARGGSTIIGQADGGDGFDVLKIVGDVTIGNVVNFEELLLDTGSLLRLSSDLSVDRLVGADISGNTIKNIVGNGFDLYYSLRSTRNAYLGGQAYLLADGSRLVGIPEPGTLALFLPGLLLLARRRRG